jgi:hypothetical protein
MVQNENFNFLLFVSVVIIAFFIVFIVNYNNVAGTTEEEDFNATSASESYSDSKIGVSIEHPVDWKVTKLKNGFQLVKEKNMVYVEIRKHDDESSNTDLQQYVDDYIKERSSTREEFKLLNKTSTTISGNLPAYTALYTFLKTENQKDFSTQEKNKILRFWTILGGNVYIIAYVSEEGKFDLYLPHAQKIIESFKIKDLEKDTDVNDIETSSTESNDDGSGEFSKKYLEQDDVNKVENRTTATAPITSDNVSISSPEVKPDNITQTETDNVTQTETDNITQTETDNITQTEIDNVTQTETETETETDNITQTETGTGDLQVYENSGFGISLLYPAGWEKKEDLTTESVRFVPPREDKDDKYLQTIDLFTYPSMSMNQATESLTNYYESSLKNYTASGSPRTSINANYSSVSMNYTFSDATAGNIRSMDILISPQSSDKTYLVTYRDEASKFESNLPELQKIIGSIKFLK